MYASKRKLASKGSHNAIMHTDSSLWQPQRLFVSAVCLTPTTDLPFRSLPMEYPVKDGILYIQHPKFGKKTWRKVWAQLFADSPSGVARLEYFEAREGASGEKATLRKGERKVIRLSDCVSLERASEHSSPKDTTPFYLCMMERNCLLAADQSDEWVEHICQLAFQKTPASSSSVGNTPSPPPVMEENTIYSSLQETSEFPVTVYPTEASAKCQLTGNYLIVPSPEHLLLKNAQTRKTIYSWPYVFLRRFGQKKNTFSFEAGRRCESGEGLFTFNTARAAEINQVVSAAIDCQKALLLKDKKLVTSSSQGQHQKAMGWLWPASMESQEEVQPFYPGVPKGTVETGLPRAALDLSHSVSSELEAPEPHVIYASIGRSFLPLRSADLELQQHSEELSDHLYENLQARLSSKDFLEESGRAPSPIYDNKPPLTKHASSSLGTGVEAPLESLHPPQLSDCLGNESGGEGNGRPKSRSTGAFKHKLVTMLSRDGGASKPSNKNSCPVQK